MFIRFLFYYLAHNLYLWWFIWCPILRRLYLKLYAIKNHACKFFFITLFFAWSYLISTWYLVAYKILVFSQCNICQHILTWHLIVKHAQMKWHLLVSCPPTYSRTASFEPWSFSLRNSSNMAASSWRYSSARSSFFSSAWEISSSLLISFLLTPREYWEH